MTLLILAAIAIAIAGEPIPAEFVRPLVLDDAGNLIAGPSLAELDLEPGEHSLSDVYADWLDTIDEPDSSDRTLEMGIRLYVDQSTSTVYACSCPFRCSSAGCDYIVDTGFGGLSALSCNGECEALETCTAPAPGTEQPSDETETGGDLQSPDQLDCALLSCAEENMHPSEDGYHGWITDMLERTQ